jgi:hypothetical protein
MKALSFKPAENSGDKTYSEAVLSLYTPNVGIPKSYASGSFRDERNRQLRTCTGLEAEPRDDGRPLTAAPGALIPLVAKTGSALISILSSHLEAKTNSLKEQASQPYTARFWVAAEAGTPTPWPAMKSGCLVVDRRKPGTEDLGMTMILKPRPIGRDGFVLRLWYARFDTALAITEKPSNEEALPAINVSVAIAIKGLHGSAGKIPQLSPLSYGTLSFKIDIGGDAFICAESRQPNSDELACPATELMPIPLDKSVYEISGAVVETGNVGFSIDLVQAERIALMNALGSGIESFITEKLKSGKE